MNAKLYTAYDADTPDRVYGEVYEYEGAFWAETILIEDGLDWVIEKSPDFVNRLQAVAWLAERELYEPATLLDKLDEYFGSEALARYWTKLTAVFGSRQPRNVKTA